MYVLILLLHINQSTNQRLPGINRRYNIEDPQQNASSKTEENIIIEFDIHAIALENKTCHSQYKMNIILDNSVQEGENIWRDSKEA